MSDDYTAANIRILHVEEAAERFGFAKAADLAERYPEISSDFIARLVEACYLSGWPVELAERRYLAHDMDGEAPPPDFFEAHRDLVRAAQRGAS